jgi:hypothetical protein
VHPFSGECKANVAIATNTGNRVQALIQVASMIGGALATDIPLWFHAGDTAHGTVPCEYAPFEELCRYDTELGSLGYIPTALHPALAYYGVIDRAKLIRDISLAIAKGAHETWMARCNTFTTSGVWLATNTEAAARVGTGD